MSRKRPERIKVPWKLHMQLAFYRILFKLKKIKLRSEKRWINVFIFLAFASVVVGLIILIVFLVKLSYSYTVRGNNIELEKTAQVGDFIGGVIGAIWSLTGILLFYATLRLQSKELRENRNSFQLSRLTDIVYRQLELFNQQFQLLIITRTDEQSDGEILTGRAAAGHILRTVRNYERFEKAPQETKTEIARELTANHFVFIEKNNQGLHDFFINLNSHVRTLQSVFIRDEVLYRDLNELKGIFFRNIGKDITDALPLLVLTYEAYINFRKAIQKDFDEKWSIEWMTLVNISSVYNYSMEIYDKDIMRSYRQTTNAYHAHF